MTKQPLPRYRTTLHITVDLSASTDDEADQRLERIGDEIMQRLGKTTFQRLPGKPEAAHVEWFNVDPV